MILDERSRRLHLYLPRLPNLQAPSLGLGTASSWIEELFWMNCGARLVKLGTGALTELDILESCLINRESTSYRLQIRKGRLFSQGDEITAHDVIASLLRVARQAHSLSQLGSILRFQGSELSRSFKVHTRYRFEIFLNATVADLLERLALPECSIFRSPEVSSGAWYLASASKQALLLKVHPLAAAKPELPYDELLIQTLDQAPASSSRFTQAFLAIFPGTLAKAPQSNALSEAVTIKLRPQLLLGVWLQHKTAGSEALKQCLQAFSRQSSTWNKQRLTQLYEQHSYATEVPSHEVSHDSHSHTWTLSFNPELIAAAFLEDLTAFAQNRHQIQLQFIPQPCSGADDGQVFALPEYAAEASFCSMQWSLQLMQEIGLGGDALSPLLQKIQGETQSLYRQKLFRELVHKLVHHPQFIALARTPLLVHSNRSLLNVSSLLGSLRLDAVGESVHREQSKELRHATVSALGSAVQMLAHDIKRPFAMLDGILKLLAANEDPVRVRELATTYFPVVRRMSQTVQEMITDILEMGAEGELLTEPLSPVEILDECLRLMPPSLKQISLKCDWQHRLMLEGDRYKVTRILTNILNNAIQASPDQGHISITSRERHDGTSAWMEIEVFNTGSYISPEKRQKIFEAFYTEGKEQGTGLGLAIVKKFVLAHEGHLQCESDPQRGTSFIFTLPSSYKLDHHKKSIELRDLWQRLSPQSPASPLPLPSASRPQRTVKLLLIDDDPLDIQYVRDLLTHLQAADAVFFLEMRAVQTPERGIELARQEAFDIVLIDFQLGSSNGLSWIPLLKQLQAGAWLALHSHLSERTLQQQALAAGAHFFFAKPLQLPLLHDLCQKALAPKVETSVLVVEDDPLFTEIWQTYGGPALRCFASPRSLLEAWREEPTLLAACRALISDGLFDNDTMDGESFLESLAESCPSLALYLCSHLPQTVKAKNWTYIDKDPERIAAFLHSLLGPTRTPGISGPNHES